MKKVDRVDLATRRSKRVHGFVSIDYRVNIRAVYNIACSDLISGKMLGLGCGKSKS